MNELQGKGSRAERASRANRIPWVGRLLPDISSPIALGALCALCGSFLGGEMVAQPIRAAIVNITRLHGAMPNELTGVGLVTGLDGTGASDKASRLAAQNLIRRYNINVKDGDLSAGSFALVMVNATLPPFSKEGMQLNARVSTLSDASSLYGGYLQEVQLLGPDKVVYSLASGPLSVSGFAAAVQGTSVTRNHVTTGDVPGGALVVQEAPSYYISEEGNLELQLINPDLRTATNIADAINAVLENTGCKARAQDHTLVQIQLPSKLQTDDDAIRILRLVSPVAVHVHKRAVVAIDASAGVIVAGEGVMISPCVVAVSDLTISVVSEDEVSQPLPGWNRGTTETVNRTRIDVNTDATEVQSVAGGATVNELVTNLKALQLSPRHLIQVFERLADAGYLHAELIVK